MTISRNIYNTYVYKKVCRTNKKNNFLPCNVRRKGTKTDQKEKCATCLVHKILDILELAKNYA